MKKTTMILMVMILVVMTFVQAGELEIVPGETYIDWQQLPGERPVIKVIDIGIDSDTVKGHSVEELLKDNAATTNNYGGGSRSEYNFWKIITGDGNLKDSFEYVIDYFNTIFSSRKEVDVLRERISTLECQLLHPESVQGLWKWQYCVEQKRADFTGKVQELNGLEFYPK